MSEYITGLHIKNFRSLADVSFIPGKVNVLFGPNGTGKSTFLDTIWFLRDCAIRGVDSASSDRSHGIGLCWDGAGEESNIWISLETELAQYDVSIGYSSGRIEPFVGETLLAKRRQIVLLERKIGSDKASFYHSNLGQSAMVELREPQKLALTKYLDFEEDSQEATSVDRVLRYTHAYPSRVFDFRGLKKFGSESSYQTTLLERGQNLWSVLRNLSDKRRLDTRYETIIQFMREAFPSFDELILEQTTPSTVYASFLEKRRRAPIQASGVSDGHLQMLLLLTALFSAQQHYYSLILFDEPETSLHPYALAVLAKAIETATNEWNKQVFVATHSPVLVSQFDLTNIYAVEAGADGKTTLLRISDMPEIQDLLEQYALGSLYMAEAIAPQSKVFAESSLS